MSGLEPAGGPLHPGSVADVKTGTTTVGLQAKDAVVLAADMQASVGHIAYELEAPKVYVVTNHIAMTNAGSVADSQVLIRFIKYHAQLYEIERNAPFTPKALSTYLSNVLNANRYFPYGVQFIVGGFVDKPALYEIGPFGSVLERKAFALSGSGTTFALSVLDTQYRKNMKTEEAMQLAVRAILEAKKRDVFSGGKSFSIAVADKEGARLLSQEEVEKVAALSQQGRPK